MTILSMKAPAFRALLFLFFSFTLTTLQAQTCDNLTDGGSISGDESGCSNPTFDPSTITSIAAATGGSGTIQYVWMKTTGNPDSPFNTWQIIPGATGETYDPTPITETTYYGRCSRRAGCTEYLGETNFVVKSISCCDINATITPSNSTICSMQPLSLSATGNGTGLTYLWEATGGSFNDSTSANPIYTMMMEGTYTIKVTIIKDDCMEMVETTVTVNNQLSVTISADQDYIGTNQNLQLSSTISGNNPTYSWTSTGGAFNNNTLPNPTYSATTQGDYQIILAATDENGCSGIDTFDIKVGTCTLTLSEVIENTSCGGGNDGSINLTISGGSPSYTYAWSNNLPDSNFVNNLAIGTYNVTVTDADGCQGTGTYIIEATDSLTLTTSTTDPACGSTNETGTATVTASGGNSPYTYAWNDATNQTTATATNLVSGSYQVIVTDANGCQNSTSVTINNANNSSIDLMTTITNTTCNNSIGAIDLTISGGTSPFSIAWDNGIGATEDPINLSAGTYNVTVTDASNCSNTTSAIVSEESTVSVTISKSDIICNGRNDGTATAVAVGGTGNYSYNWDAGLTPTATQTGLTAGTYTVTATDSNGCQSTASTTITQPTLLTVIANPTATNCTDQNGSAIANVTGGTAPYTYEWNDSSNQTTQTAVNLPPGDYSVVVRDANQCGQAANVTINGNMGIVVTLSTTDALCNGENSGTVTTNVLNGTAPFTYTWNNFLPNLPGFTGLAQGIYEVTVEDVNGCFGTASAKVHGADSLIVTPVVENASCTRDDGRARLDVRGGTPPYSYAWAAPLNNFTNIINGLTTGSYEYTVTDGNGCTQSDVIIVLRDTDCVDSCKVVSGNISTNDLTTICVGDGVPDNITVSLTGNQGANNSWIITDESQNILELPNNNTFNFDGAGIGTCLIWNISYEGTIGGLAVGQNIANLTGCRALSTSIPVIRQDCTPVDTCMVNGGTISTNNATTICIGDGVPDNITVSLTGNQGANNSWIITDESQNILELPNNNTFNFDGAGIGTCLIWNISYKDTIVGLVVGQNIANLTGCRALSTSIPVIRQDCTPVDTCMVNGGTISTNNPTTICIGDGVPDNITVSLTGNQGANNRWVITDESQNILELPNNNTFNFDGAGIGTCLIWNISYKDSIVGLVVGQNIANLTGCRALSTSIPVIRQDCTPVDTCMVNGGTISTTNPTTICVGDGVPDNITVSLTGNQGANNRWVITDESQNILELPNNNTFNFDGAGIGTCLIWNISYKDSIVGLVVGQNIANLTGCRALSTSIPVIRQDCTPVDTCMVNGGTISTTNPTTICVGDGVPDNITVSLTGNQGANNRWVITDESQNILELPNNNTFNFDGAGIGTCLIWNISYKDSIVGLVVGQNIANLTGCRALSTSIPVIRQDCTPVDTCMVNGGTISTTNATTICVGDGVPDNITVSLTGNQGANNRWVITDESQNILELPNSNIFNFDGAGLGTCLIWNVSYEEPISGLVVGQNASNLSGCLKLSNSIRVIRQDCTPVCTTTPSTISTTDATAFCVGDGTPDTVSINLALGSGDFSRFIITDTALNILEVSTNTIYDFENVNAGVCLIWNITYANGLTGLAAGNTISDLTGCYKLSNAITVVRQDCTPDPCINFAGSVKINNPASGTICSQANISLSTTPADADFTYNWTSTGGTFDNATSPNPNYTMMMPGTYEIIVTINKGTCVTRDTTIVTILSGPEVELTATDVTCSGENNGTISATVTGGTAPYSYTWNSSSIGDTASANNLGAAFYEVIVTDANGCTATNATTIAEGGNISLTLTPTNSICGNANDGTITAIISGGQAPFTYTWSNGGPNTSTLTNLAAGEYSLTVTDTNGCTVSETTTITQPTPFAVSIISTSREICSGESVNFGVAPADSSLTYQWIATGGNFDDANSATPVYTMVMAGTYEIILNVSNGTCTASDTTAVTIRKGVDFTITSTNISCVGETDGSINVTINDGVAPFTYSWDNGIGNIPNPTGLAAGTYELTITDGNSCSKTANVIIENANPIVLDLNSTNISCGGDTTGTADALATGGNGAFSFAWSNGATEPSINNLSSGTYSLTVTDTNGCIAIDSISITRLTPLTAITEGVNVGCNESGHAHVTVSGGTAPYTYLWNDPAAQTTDTAFNLVAGVYTVVVTDANGCTVSESVTINETDGITCSIIVLEDITSFGGSEGALGVNVTGGSGNYTYSWNNGGMDSTITNLGANNYIVTITDETGCVCTDTLRLLNPAILGDFVFQDVDSSGTQEDGEPGVEGITLQLTGTTYYGVNIVRNTTTDETGIYQFPVPPGTYKVTVVDALGYNFTNQNAGVDDGLDSDFNPATNMSQVLTLNENDVDLSIDLGLLISDVCRNILLGGTIEKNETVCSSNADPAIMTNVSTPTGGMGHIEYLWLKSDITPDYYPGSPDWKEIPNTNSPDYDPGVITKTTWYVRCARRAGCDSYPGESNIIEKTVVECLANPIAENLRTNVQSNQVELIWEGKVPYENGYYIIERSTDDGASYKVVNVMACPKTETMNEYHFMDEVPKFGENYYKIKVVVPNMSNAFTNIAMAMVKPNEFQRVLAYPNPVQNEVTIQFLEELKEVAKVQIINGFGQVMKSIDMDTATKKQQIDLSDLPSGMYYLKFNNRSLKRFGQKIYKVEE